MLSFSTVLQNIVKIFTQYWDVFLIKGVGVTLLLSFITLGIYTFWLGIKLKKWKVKHTRFA